MSKYLTYKKVDAEEIITIGDVVMIDPKNGYITRAVKGDKENAPINARMVIGVCIDSNNVAKPNIVIDGGQSADTERVELSSNFEKVDLIYLDGGNSEQNFNNGTSQNFNSGATQEFYEGSNQIFHNGSQETKESGSTTTYESGSTLVFESGATTDHNGDTTNYNSGSTINYGSGTTQNVESGATVNFENGSNLQFTCEDGSIANIDCSKINHWDDAKGEYVQLSAQEFRETYDKDNLPTLTFFHPDKYVARTVDDLVAGRDPQLEAALTYLAK